MNNNKFEYGQGADYETTTGSVGDYLTSQGVKNVFQINMRNKESHILPTEEIEPAVMETFGGLDILYTETLKPYYPNFRNIFGT